MNRLSMIFIWVVFSLVSTWTYAVEGCSDNFIYKVDTNIENGEPISILSIKYNEEAQLSFTVPFTSGNSSCERLNDNGLIKILVTADRPKMREVYYFDVANKLYYIGSASILTSSGEERVSGIGEIKNNGFFLVDFDGVASEDAAIIRKIMSIPSEKKNSNISKLYNEMRYIEIDELSENTGSKICDRDDRVFYYCKTRSGKNLNLCYSPFSGDITYVYGKKEKELSINNFSLIGETFIFKNKNTSYNVSPDKGEISVIQNGKILSVIPCV
ncbi:hypothetical protein [Aeromonas simiae]|uniref:hypothetical protein n=1 Tax=Aeromonas simiae TaxID=218936 RepID=UPI0012EE499A|nr:hypothetical protein [Aeromonas simiae]